MTTFYLTFKNLLIAEKDAILTLKSETVRSHVTLSVDLGHVHSNAAVHPPRHPRNGPARTQRRERRVEARRLLAEEATSIAEKVDVSEKDTVEVENQEKPSSENDESTENVEEVLENSTMAAEQVVTGKVSVLTKNTMQKLMILQTLKFMNLNVGTLEISGTLTMFLITWVEPLI